MSTPLPGAFAALGLSPTLQLAAARNGLHQPTPIQQLAIQPVLQGADLLAQAPTGTGKTFAYGLPLLQTLLDRPGQRSHSARILVLLPTRELVLQAGLNLRSLAHHLPRALRIQMIYGGVSVNPQMMALRGGCDLLLATPGRLLDLLDKRALHLDALETLVLDEADRLLDLGFADELAALLQRLPPQRQTLMFSATFAPKIEQLAASLLEQPQRVRVEAESAAPAVVQRAIAVDAPRRTPLLRRLLETEAWPRALVFVATKLATEIVADKLRRAGIAAEPLHGALSQGKRTQVLSDFKATRIRVVVATDLAARGIDISELPVVVNFDLPRSPADYTHRSGRTGRAGASGMAVSFVTPEQSAHFALICRRNALQVTPELLPGFEPTATPADTPRSTSAGGGIKGRRPNKKDRLRAAQAITL